MVVNSDSPAAIGPIETLNNIDLSIVAELVEAKSIIDLIIVVESAQAKSIIDLIIVVESAQAKSIIDLTIVAQPSEAKNYEPDQAENENQLWFIKYRKELQGLIMTDWEIDSRYYDIHTARLSVFLHDSYVILILDGYILALIKQIEPFYLFDLHARDLNGTAVVMKFANIVELEQYLYFLSTNLHTNLFEIVPIQLNKWSNFWEKR